MPVMIDTNIFVAFFIPPVSDADVHHHSISSKLLKQVNDGAISAITSELAIHEAFYVIVMRAQSLTVDEFCDSFRSMLMWSGWTIDSQEVRIWQRALDFLEEHPKLEFSDAVIAARAEAHEAELATFDARLAKAYGGPIWAEN